MLTFGDGGKFIARVIGGKYDGEILSIIDGSKKAKEKCCVKHNRRCLKKKCCNDCSYKDDESSDDDGIGKELTLDEGIFEQVPSNPDRIIYITGPSGSGKSTYASKYISNYLKCYPKATFYVLSRLDEDKVIDELDPIRIVINEELLDDPIDITKEFTDHTIILFDDTDTIPDKRLQQMINRLKVDVMEIGRHMDIKCVITSHLVNPNDKTFSRTVMNELNTLTFFPQGGSIRQIKYTMKNYFGFENKQIENIISLGKKSRWITLFKCYPQCVMSEKKMVVANIL